MKVADARRISVSKSIVSVTTLESNAILGNADASTAKTARDGKRTSMKKRRKSVEKKKWTFNLRHLWKFHPRQVDFLLLSMTQLNRQCQPPRLESPATIKWNTSLCRTSVFGTRNVSCFVQTSPRIKTLLRVRQSKTTIVAGTCLGLGLLPLSAIFTKFDLV
eukprot:CCRYP_020708-RB/>CCRYP_020708-RB protein AED:0.35 eAED:0.35 QI:56/1/1/1/1/0.5/2/125/161